MYPLFVLLGVRGQIRRKELRMIIIIVKNYGKKKLQEIKSDQTLYSL